MIPALKLHDDGRPADSPAINAPAPGTVSAGRSAKDLAKKTAPWLVGVAIIAYLVWRIEITPLVQALSLSDTALYLTALTAFILINFLADSQNLNALLRHTGNAIPFRDSVIIRGSSYLLMIIDYTLGMGSIVYYLKKYKNVPFTRGTGSMLFMNYITHITLLIMAIAGCLMASIAGPLSSQLWNIALTATVLLALAIITVILMKLLPDRSFMKKLKQSVVWKIFMDSPFKAFLMCTLYRCAFYSTFILFFYIAVRAFNMNIPLAELVAYVPVILLVISIPISAFGLGTSQAATLLLFRNYGSPAQILAFSLAYSVSIIIFRGIIGVCYYGIINARVTHKSKASLLRGEVS